MQTTKYLTSDKDIYLYPFACCQMKKSFEQWKPQDIAFVSCTETEAKNLYDYEHEIKLVEGELKSIILYFYNRLFVVLW